MAGDSRDREQGSTLGRRDKEGNQSDLGCGGPVREWHAGEQADMGCAGIP